MNALLAATGGRDLINRSRFNIGFPSIENHSTGLFADSASGFPDHEAGEKANTDPYGELFVQNRIKKNLIEMPGQRGADGKV